MLDDGRCRGLAEVEHVGFEREVRMPLPLAVPALPVFHVARPRLLDLLDSGIKLPLTAVVAPPGAGKSITLAAWIGERCPGAVWVACEERDRDPVVLLGHVAAALRAVQGDRWLDAVELLGERDPDLELVVDTILRELEERAAVIVLDDVHVAGEARVILSRLVEHLPAGSRLVTGSRGDPPLAMHRLRADGRCLELRAADLRLSPDEVDKLVRALGAVFPPTGQDFSPNAPTDGQRACRWRRSPCETRLIRTVSLRSSRAVFGS